MGHRGAVTTGSGRGRRRVAGAWDVRMDVDYTWWARMGEARERIAVTLLEAKFRSISQYFRRDNPSHLIARREIPTSPLARIPLVSHVYFRPRAQQVKPWQYAGDSGGRRFIGVGGEGGGGSGSDAVDCELQPATSPGSDMR